jgi:D-cysteine desulfhydrase
MTEEREPYLFKKFPGLRGKVPWTRLGSLPTPVDRMEKLGERLGCSRLYVKRDDVSGRDYGGNKVRKLEFTLADARDRGRGPVITAGAVGSNHVLATTIYAGKLGMRAVGIFAPQPVQENLRTNILCNCHLGCRIEYIEGDKMLFVRAVTVYLGEWIKNRRRPYLLLPGGSSTLGVLGYVDAAFEIAEQVEQGALPEPEFIFVPVGSSGTLAGLVLGVRLAGLDSRPVGVRVYDKSFANEKVTAFLASRAASYLHKRDPEAPKIKIASEDVSMLHDYFGRGYARYTRKAVEAMKLAKELEGMSFEGTYSGKALAGFIDFMGREENRDKPALFINTYNSRPLDPLLESCPGPEILPESIREYFHKDIAPVED